MDQLRNPTLGNRVWATFTFFRFINIVEKIHPFLSSIERDAHIRKLVLFSASRCIDPRIDERDPQWIGAWWLGFVVCAACLFLWALPLSMFPSQLTGYDVTGHDVSRDTPETTTHGDKNLISNLKG